MSVAEDFGAEVIVRPDELASDTALVAAWRHAIKIMKPVMVILKTFVFAAYSTPS